MTKRTTCTLMLGAVAILAGAITLAVAGPIIGLAGRLDARLQRLVIEPTHFFLAENFVATYEAHDGDVFIHVRPPTPEDGDWYGDGPEVTLGQAKLTGLDEVPQTYDFVAGELHVQRPLRDFVSSDRCRVRAEILDDSGALVWATDWDFVAAE